MKEINSIVDNIEFDDVLSEIINSGLGRAAKVIGELVDSNVVLGVAKIYATSSMEEFKVYSDRVVVQEIVGEEISGKNVFSMGDEELMKLIRYLEGIDELTDVDNAQYMEVILDTYQEIGNIILGNIISGMINFLKTKAEIKVPYITDKSVFESFKGNVQIVVDVMFSIDKLNAQGKICLINEYKTYLKILEKSKGM